MDSAESNRGEQHALWNGPAGRAWVESQELLDQLLQPFADVLIESLAPAPGARVLDVGCGTGTTTLALARRVGASGQSSGVDISEPMVALARRRAAREGSAATFTVADAQSYPFERALYDAIASRFGVMFFDDPLAAFANLRRAAKEGAPLRFVAWRSAAENPFMTAAERAAAPLLPGLPARRPDGPGQFAFGDGERVRAILAASGWSAITVQPIDLPCSIPGTELMPYVTRLGPVGRALEGVDAALRARVLDAVRAAFDGYLASGEVRFTGACWLVAARA